MIMGWILSVGEALFDFVSKNADNLKSSRISIEFQVDLL